MLCQEMQSEFCYLTPLWHRTYFRGVGKADDGNKIHCIGHLRGHHFRQPQSPA